MPKGAGVEEFVELVRALKAQDGRSYEALGRRLSVSACTLHRYRSGATVPEDLAVVDRLALLCGADEEERRALGGGGPRPPPSGLALACAGRVGRAGIEPETVRARARGPSTALMPPAPRFGRSRTRQNSSAGSHGGWSAPSSPTTWLTCASER
ncbi:helix-turn-helix transcriptional regulator [Streptomyces cyaneofuscatus]|uniref:Helix-turn-helix domain-containing protein n=1 Tax=Streptomyces cyaneofuscatus TaxID=66883 RepID=A0ABZ1EXE5_9ACTN|nr:helix-turn-helix transcriptional regulator [Streptomyces cyaneofuscatus]WSB08661.1 helix-turn-helix domain-containing protein [Streptomyces cyaneofuscatus]WSD47805.1 helix-turn-helix domain-containing protein [Streptomyces cyaneofuscatus]